ncbi:hypothetical protein FOA43_002633 [Brettanomyces nanus]|uniref:Nodulin-like domain-containing protein n=1 Tax=Eeniella nana TaxID=13502 RepID=A0A875S5H1_EENNA|nr:uncharacterized protein FOA43_002633 [Brettanomyces nanus]QPG75282.1 hypothetical protein FOA43_002633 [Brettanomyces nanus]
MSLRYMKGISLLVSSFVSLASGTPYLYGIYSPQLLARCGFSALDSSYLSFSTNIGSSICGFFAGLLIDRFGPQLATGLGALLEFSGFYILYLSYRYELHRFDLLLVAMVNVGFGSVLAYFSTLKVSTINFPHNKGAANSCPVSAYGLAALFYAFISTIFFPDNTQGLLRFIALFAGIVMGIGVVFVRIYDDNGDADLEDNSTTPVVSSGMADSDESGFKYILKGHRGSLAQVNLIRSESSASLFSTVSEASSLSGSLSRSSSYSSCSGNDSGPSEAFPIDMPRTDSHSHLSTARGSIHPSVGSLLSASPSPVDLKARAQSRLTPHSTPLGTPHAQPSWFAAASQIRNHRDDERAVLSTNVAGKLSRSNSSSLSFTARSSTAAIENYQSPGELEGPMGAGEPPATSSNLARQPRKNSGPTLSAADTPDVPSLESRHGSPSTNKSSGSVLVESMPSVSGVFSSHPEVDEAKSAKYLEIFNKRKAKVRKNKHLHDSHLHHHSHKHITAKDHVLGLLRNKLFLSHYVLNAFYCSIGQLYIYSVGFIVKAQLNNQKLNPSLLVLTKLMLTGDGADEDLASPYQALQVSIISFANFLGRIISGPMSDFFAKTLKMSRIWVIMIALAFSTLGQISLLIFNDISSLSFTSLLIGVSYGAVYGTLPSLTAESFGSQNFATTWALIGTGPIMVFLALSNYFGKDYDNHSQFVDDGQGNLIKVCLKGGACYRNVFWLNTCICCTLFVGYSVLLRVSKKIK